MELLTLDEAARKLRVCGRTLSRLAARGEGPALTRIGRRVFVRADHLAAWIERCSSDDEANDDAG